MKRTISVFVVVACALLCKADTPRYVIEPVSPPGRFAQAVVINNAEDVYAWIGPGDGRFFNNSTWSQVLIPGSNGPGIAVAINDLGSVVFGNINFSNNGFGVIWNQKLGYYTLQTLSQSDIASPKDINNAGVTVGFTNGPTGWFTATQWNEHNLQFLTPPLGFFAYSASVVDNAGRVYGMCNPSGNGSIHYPVMWFDNKPQLIGIGNSFQVIGANDSGKFISQDLSTGGLRVHSSGSPILLWQESNAHLYGPNNPGAFINNSDEVCYTVNRNNGNSTYLFSSGVTYELDSVISMANFRRGSKFHVHLVHGFLDNGSIFVSGYTVDNNGAANNWFSGNVLLRRVH